MTLFLFLAAATAAAPTPSVAASAAARTPAATFAAVPLADAQLDQSTAREDVSLTATSDQAASVSNNSVAGTSVTGAVTIDGNAFQNAQGLTLINANSGNNVAINSSLNVTISFAPAP